MMRIYSGYSFALARSARSLVRHIRGDQPGETEMKTTTLRLVSFGSARGLTMQDIDGDYLEFTEQPSRVPMG